MRIGIVSQSYYPRYGWRPVYYFPRRYPGYPPVYPPAYPPAWYWNRYYRRMKRPPPPPVEDPPASQFPPFDMTFSAQAAPDATAT